MNKSIIFAVVLVVLGLIEYTNDKNVSGTFRYQITVNVETPEGMKSGSAVREIYAEVPHFRIHDAGSGPSVRGEAVVVELDERGTLFALISYKSYYEFFDAFPYQASHLGSAEAIGYFSALQPGLKSTLKNPKYYPRFITFGNLDDRSTVNIIEAEDFETIFGEDVVLKDIEIETTNDPIDWKIESTIERFGYAVGPFDRSRFIRKR